MLAFCFTTGVPKQRLHRIIIGQFDKYLPPDAVYLYHGDVLLWDPKCVVNPLMDFKSSYLRTGRIKSAHNCVESLCHEVPNCTSSYDHSQTIRKLIAHSSHSEFGNSLPQVGNVIRSLPSLFKARSRLIFEAACLLPIPAGNLPFTCLMWTPTCQ